MPRNEKKNEKVAGGTMSRKVKAILELLDRHYPGAGCSLEFQSPLQLLIATILSAQCTDERVNMVVPALFRKYPSAKAYAGASQEELETDIHSTGFFRNKAKNIIACCSILDRDYGGEVPADLDALVKLPGIGRKNGQRRSRQCFRDSRHRGRYPRGSTVEAVGTFLEHRSGEDRTRSDGNHSPREMDSFLSPTDPAWPCHMPGKKAENLRLSDARILRLCSGTRGMIPTGAIE